MAKKKKPPPPQAGKGDKPRPVKGEEYRRNWDRVFKGKKENK